MPKQKQKPAWVVINCAFDSIVALDDLRENPSNPNTHPDNQVELLAKLIRHHGWRAPIAVSTRSGFVVRGHGRLAAARLLGLETAPVDFQDYATAEDELADLVADNRIAELAEIDDSKLNEVLEELSGLEFDLDLAGFEVSEVEKVLGYFQVEEAPAPNLASGDRAPFRHATFTLHDSQWEEVERAVKKAKEQGAGLSDINSNSNGNALAWICRGFFNGDS